MENRKNGDFLMFQIESYHQWFFGLGSCFKRFNVQIGGPNARHQDWNKDLAPGQSYTCIPAAFCAGKSLNEVLGQMTLYRRHLKPVSFADEKLPSIYNEYMHYSWDNPFAKTTLETAPTVAKTGCKYYIIDAGWHGKAKYDTTASMYRNFGTWREDRERFPEGIKAVSDYVHSLGMKFGLWIAPEVVGCDNQEMLDYYGDECFIARNGEKVYHGSGYLLDYRHPKVIEYMTATIDRMVTEYGCDYIKFDGCPNPGMGTDVNATGLGDGLEKSMDAFTDWAYEMTQRHPDVIFEDSNGEIDEIFEEDLPYDINQPVIELDNEGYGIWYLDSLDHLERYIGKTIRFKGMVLRPQGFANNYFVPGRKAMTCCADDMAFLGFACEYSEAYTLKEKEWVEVTATISKEYWPDYKGEGPILHAVSVVKTKAPKNEIISFV